MLEDSFKNRAKQCRVLREGVLYRSARPGALPNTSSTLSLTATRSASAGATGEDHF